MTSKDNKIQLSYVEFMYKQWLMNMVRSRSGRNPDDYHLLIDYLYEHKYEWSISLDANRATDGENLRKQFESDVKNGNIPWVGMEELFYEDFLEKRCNLLEMLIALSYRCEYDIMGAPGEEKPYRWFWEFIDNLGLGKLTDDKFNTKKCDLIVSSWLNRTFRPDGKGSIFPLKHPYRDQTEIQIWEQMNQYLNEKYPIL